MRISEYACFVDASHVGVLLDHHAVVHLLTRLNVTLVAAQSPSLLNASLPHKPLGSATLRDCERLFCSFTIQSWWPSTPATLPLPLLFHLTRRRRMSVRVIFGGHEIPREIATMKWRSPCCDQLQQHRRRTQI